MGDPKKPERLSRERLGEIRKNARRFGDLTDEEAEDILQEVDALTAELEERTRERDEAVAHLRDLVDACGMHEERVGPYGECPGKIWTAEIAQEWLDQKGPADDR